jgi:hypothetical protein
MNENSQITKLREPDLKFGGGCFELGNAPSYSTKGQNNLDHLSDR